MGCTNKPPAVELQPFFAFGNGKLRLNTRQDARYELGKLLESFAKGLYLAEANSQMGKSKRKRREERERGSEGGVEEPG